MKIKILTAAILACGLACLPSCKDEFAELNSKPSDISNPDIRFLFTQCQVNFEPADYQQWYNAFRISEVWVQSGVAQGGNSASANNFDVGSTGGSGCGYRVNSVLQYANEIRYQIGLMNEENKAKYEYIQYLCNPLCVFLSMEDSDVYGSRQYSQAKMYDYGGPMLPEYDTQEKLFEIWLKQLDETINYLTTHNITGVLSGQDIIYKDDVKKWAKLANSLKLKVAARLIHVNKARAIQVVNEAAASSAGLIENFEDDFVYNRGKNDNHWNNNYNERNAGSKQLIDFMVKNADPRLFYFFTKNEYNSNVVQGFLEQRPEMLPSYIAENIETEEINGKKVFKNWKAPGEPWVRYYGLPSWIDAGEDITDDHFDKSGNRFHLLDEQNTKKTYQPISLFNQESIKGGFTYTYPDVPGVTPQQDIEPYGWYGLYFSAGETNLYLAEFKLLGANLPKSANEYYRAGIEQSVRGYDYVAGKNHIPYYDVTYANDKHDKSIKLTENMITEMMNHDIYQLTGDVKKDLEKVYLQQYIHYTMLPNDQYVTSRRSGVPMRNSEILSWVEFSQSLGANYLIPRRYSVSKPLDSDKLKDITIKAYEEQGYTYDGINAYSPENLNKERIWYDKGAPQFGEGPNVQ